MLQALNSESEEAESSLRGHAAFLPAEEYPTIKGSKEEKHFSRVIFRCSYK